MHGIGEHGAWSALGKPKYEPVEVPEGAPQFHGRRDIVEYSRPPRLTDHELLLVNWSRTSRRGARFFWFLALPFTLVNVAHFMKPRGDTPWEALGRWLLKAATTVVGVAMTIAATVWLVCITESLLKNVPGSDNSLAYRFNAGVVTASVIVAIVWRHLRRWENSTSWPQVVIHAGAVACVAALLLLGRPAQWGRLLPGIDGPLILTPVHCPHHVPELSCSEPRLDFMATIVIGSTGLAFVFAVLLLVAHWRARASDPSIGPSLAGAAALLPIGMITLHTLGSLLRVAVDWLGVYVRSLVRIVHTYDPPYLSVPFRTVTPYHPNQNYAGLASPHYEIDLVVIAFVGIVLTLGLSALIVFSFAPNGPRHFERPDPDGRGDRSLQHRITMTLSNTLAPVLVLFTAMVLGGCLATLWWDVPNRGQWKALTSTLLVQVAAVLLLLILAGRFPRIRSALAMVADLAGFWRVREHPLAGTSYRPGVLQGLVKLISDHADRPVVLVGHSQGSVICAWVAAACDEATREGLTRPRRRHRLRCARHG